MNARARHARAVIRAERRRRREEKQRDRARAYVADRRRRSLAAQKAAGLWPAPPAARVAQLMKHWALGDGIAYVPNDDPRLPRPGEHQEQLAPRTAGKRAVTFPFAPINAAYWMGAEEDQADGHTHDHMCPDCGPCRKDDPPAYVCDCCGCEEDERIMREDQETYE